jgi:cell wall assembly regulator SMI1
VFQFDADPTPSGDYGQIIKYTHDPDVIDYICPSFLAFFQRSNSILENAIETLSDDLESIREVLSM